MIKAYQCFWTRSFDFQGVSNRQDYWWAYLANLIILIFLGVLSGATDIFGVLYLIYTIAGVIPNLSISIRRVRDMGRNWPWIFINIIPLVGAIWFIILLCQPSIPIA